MKTQIWLRVKFLRIILKFCRLKDIIWKWGDSTKTNIGQNPDNRILQAKRCFTRKVISQKLSWLIWESFCFIDKHIQRIKILTCSSWLSLYIREMRGKTQWFQAIKELIKSLSISDATISTNPEDLSISIYTLTLTISNNFYTQKTKVEWKSYLRQKKQLLPLTFLFLSTFFMGSNNKEHKGNLSIKSLTILTIQFKWSITLWSNILTDRLISKPFPIILNTSKTFQSTKNIKNCG